MRLVPAAFVAALLAAPLPVLAQPVPIEPSADDGHSVAEKFADPEFQQDLAKGLAAMSDVLLDLPLAPLMRAMGEMTGEELGPGEDDATLREIAPDAGRVANEIEDRVPAMMGAMAGMAGAMEALLPALGAMAERMEEEVARADLR